jgi:anti-anti-sigma factor
VVRIALIGIIVTVPEMLEDDQPPPTPAGGDVQVFFDDHLTLVRLAGPIDLALGPELEDAGRDAIDRGRPIEIDLSRVSFMDCIGVGFVARMFAAAPGGRRPTLSRASQLIAETLAVAGVYRLRP